MPKRRPFDIWFGFVKNGSGALDLGFLLFHFVLGVSECLFRGAHLQTHRQGMK